MNRLRALLMGFAATVGAGGIAAYNGVFSPQTPPAPLASTTAPAGEPVKTEPNNTEPAKVEPAKVEPATKDVAKTEPATAAPAVAADLAKQEPSTATEAPAALSGVTAPTFDVLRVEPSGSVLIAGKAGSGEQVEVLSGADILGVTKAEANGDFAIVLQDPLKPGDYQLVLRATGKDGKSAASVETATVSVPTTANGPVLALVEEPGKPSRIITTPEAPAEVAQTSTAQTTLPAAETPTVPADAVPADAVPAASAEIQVGGEVKAPVAEAPAAVTQSVVIEAVETEDGKIFIAGSAKGVATVRLYANDQALGDAKPGEGDRFLGEFTKDLPAGDYIIRAEGLAADGVTMIATSSVPFQRQADVAVAPEATTPAAPATEPATANAEPAAAPEPVKPKAVIIRRGDTLWQISRRVYGRGVRYSTIYLANQEAITNPNRIFPGQVFKVPEKTAEGDAADPAEIEKRAAPAEIAPVQ